MLADRSYMRDTDYRPPITATAVLTIALIAIFALQCIDDAYLHSNAQSYLALTDYGLRRHWYWQLISFQVLHGNLIHILCNILTFWWVGRYAETVMGPTRMLVAFFGSGLVGGLFQGALMQAFPGVYGSAVVGASAGVAGLIAIFALLERDTVIRLNFIFPMRAITFLWILLGISLFFILVPSSRNMGVADGAHLGGLLAGIAWVRFGWHQEFAATPGTWLRDKFKRPELRVLPGRSSRDPVKPAPPSSTGSVPLPGVRWTTSPASTSIETSEAEFMTREVDPILDKIAAHGLQSLTDRERKTLELARDKMGRR